MKHTSSIILGLSIVVASAFSVAPAFGESSAFSRAVGRVWPKVCGALHDDVAEACGGTDACACDSACDAYEERCHKGEGDTYSEGVWSTYCKERKDCDAADPGVASEISEGKETLKW